MIWHDLVWGWQLECDMWADCKWRTGSSVYKMLTWVTQLRQPVSALTSLYFSCQWIKRSNERNCLMFSSNYFSIPVKCKYWEEPGDLMADGYWSQLSITTTKFPNPEFDLNQLFLFFFFSLYFFQFPGLRKGKIWPPNRIISCPQRSHISSWGRVDS